MFASSYLLAAGIFLCSSPVERCECSTEICLLERNSSNGSAPASTAVLLSFGPASNSCELQATIEVVSNASTSNCSQQSPSIEESSSTSSKFLVHTFNTRVYFLSERSERWEDCEVSDSTDGDLWPPAVGPGGRCVSLWTGSLQEAHHNQGV